MNTKSLNVVDFIFDLFEDSKFFLNLANINVANIELTDRYSRASVLLAWAAFEGWINKTCSDFEATSQTVSVFEKGFLLEKKIEIKNGEFVLNNTDKYQSTENKIEFLLKKFACYKIDKSTVHWNSFKLSKELRDFIIHPKKNRIIKISIDEADKNLKTLQYFIKLLSKKLYHKDLKF
ncbi:MAG TPA: hypothetical protein VIK14_12675 [Ignavibacteria bacterium]